METLEQLRYCVTNQLPFSIEDDYIQLGDKKYILDALTAFRSRNKEYYQLKTLITFLKGALGGNANFYGNYLTLQKKKNLQMVEWAEKKKIVDYFTSVVDVNQLPDIDVTGLFPSFEYFPMVAVAADDALDVAMKNEKCPVSNDAMLLSSKNFSSLLQTLDTVMGKEKPKGLKRANTDSSLSTSKKPKHSGIPIIIVPSALTSHITIHNVKEFLEFGKYEPDKRTSNTKVTLSRVAANDETKTVIYEVVDNVSGMSDSDWDRVVAVFCTGQTWQFNDWKWKDPAVLFEHVCGFHVHLDDEKINENVKKWSVHPLIVSKTKRYMDKSTSFEFWKILINYMTLHKRQHVKF